MLSDRLPPLGTLDELITWSTAIAFVLITLAVVAGSTWALIESGTRWIGEPKIVISLLTWGMYLVMAFLRVTVGWRGRKAAYMAIRSWWLLRADMGGARGTAQPVRSMKFSITGLNHKTAPVEVREQLAFDEGALAGGAPRAEVARRVVRGADPFHLQSRGSRGDHRR